MSLEIVTLHDRPDLVDVCAAWTFAEWGCLLGVTLAQSQAGYNESTGTGLPITFVSLIDGKPVGTVSLKLKDYEPRSDLSPWLSGMYVHPFYRKHGIASKLAQHVEKVAKENGMTKLHLITELAFNMYDRLGWKKIGEYPDKFARPGVQIHLMEKTLSV